MPKMLIIAATLVNYGDDRGGVHQDAGDLIDAPKDEARKLVDAKRALYLNKTDDLDKHGRNTASAKEIKAAEDLAKARAKEEAAKEEAAKEAVA